MMAEDQEPPVEDENLETQEGREESVASGGIDPREAAFMEGYENDEGDEEDDYGLEDDEKLED
jgi:hypothetical protein